MRPTVLIPGIWLFGACSVVSRTPENLEPVPPASSELEEQQVRLSGCFHVIWNGSPKYMLIDDQGRWTRLLLDESVTRPLGGTLALNRKRVGIVGKSVNTPSEAIRVVSIERKHEERELCG